MKDRTRTENATLNFGLGAITQLLNIIISFFVRTIFIRMLSIEYLGVNGLFSNVLSILSFAELGIGSAITHSLYKPVAVNDEEKIKSLLDLYKRAYKAIAIFIFIIGICLIPFMNLIVTSKPNISENLILLYLLFLINTVTSYLFTYKKTLIFAYQKDYLLKSYNLFFIIFKAFVQIIILMCFKNYLMYLVFSIFITILENYAIAKKSEKLFPYIRDKNIDRIAKQEEKKIFQDVKALIYYKVGSVVLNSTDNIIITNMLGLSLVGITSNYNMIINAIVGVVGAALAGFTSSIGNLNAIANREDRQRVYNQIFLIAVWIYGFICIELLILIDPFINIWLGEEYLLPSLATLALVLHTYVNGIQFAAYTYRTTCGLYTKGKFSPLIAAILNIILSIFLCEYIGISGVFFATSISRLLTTTIVDPYLVYKYEFKDNVFKYYFSYFYLTIIVICNFVLCKNAVSIIPENNLIFILLKALSIAIISNLFFLLIFYKNKDFVEIRKKVFKLMKGLIQKNKI